VLLWFVVRRAATAPTELQAKINKTDAHLKHHMVVVWLNTPEHQDQQAEAHRHYHKTSERIMIDEPRTKAVASSCPHIGCTNRNRTSLSAFLSPRI